MRTIYKYPIEIVDRATLKLPRASIVRHVGLDPSGRPCLWAEVETSDEATDDWVVYVVGTGNPIPSAATAGWTTGHDHYRGSLVQGSFVWHVYARRDRPVPV